MPLNKTQIQYLTQKLNAAHRTAVEEFKKQHPTAASNEEVIALLKKAGFVVVSEYKWIASYVQPTPLKEYETNKAKIEKFTQDSRVALEEAVDAANLGDAESALALLRDFSAALQELARA